MPSPLFETYPVTILQVGMAVIDREYFITVQMRNQEGENLWVAVPPATIPDFVDNLQSMYRNWQQTKDLPPGINN